MDQARSPITLQFALAIQFTGTDICVRSALSTIFQFEHCMHLPNDCSGAGSCHSRGEIEAAEIQLGFADTIPPRPHNCKISLYADNQTPYGPS